MDLFGVYRLEAYSPAGLLVMAARGKNLVTSAGKVRVAQIWVTNDGTVETPNYIAIGDGVTQPSEADTALAGTVHAMALGAMLASGNEVSLEATLSNVTTSVWTVAEGGILADETPDLLFSRFLTPIFTVEPGGYVQILWKIGFGSTPTV